MCFVVIAHKGFNRAFAAFNNDRICLFQKWHRGLSLRHRPGR
jgi:hypothetical protein